MSHLVLVVRRPHFQDKPSLQTFLARDLDGAAGAPRCDQPLQMVELRILVLDGIPLRILEGLLDIEITLGQRSEPQLRTQFLDCLLVVREALVRRLGGLFLGFFDHAQDLVRLERLCLTHALDGRDRHRPPEHLSVPRVTRLENLTSDDFPLTVEFASSTRVPAARCEILGHRNMGSDDFVIEAVLLLRGQHDQA